MLQDSISVKEFYGSIEMHFWLPKKQTHKQYKSKLYVSRHFELIKLCKCL